MPKRLTAADIVVGRDYRLTGDYGGGALPEGTVVTVVAVGPPGEAGLSTNVVEEKGLVRGSGVWVRLPGTADPTYHIPVNALAEAE